MADNNNVLSDLFQEIADAIRGKTGGTETMKPADFPANITAIEGSSSDVRYVTFKNGETVLYTKPVAVGDDCADIVARGLIDTPTKESTVSTVYTYSGWSLTNGGTADTTNALASVTEDRTVYATYTESVRYYTITFYDDDGTTVLTTKQVAYGTIPSYEPTKDGYDFDTWIPTPVEVTGDTSYTVQWKLKAAFETATWEQIAEICDSGQASDYFNIGDAKPVLLTYDDGTSETIKFRIVDMGVDTIEGGGKAPLTIMADNIVSISPTVLASAYNNTRARLYYMDTIMAFFDKIYAALPSDLQSVIKTYRGDPISDNYGTEIFIAHSVNLGIDHTKWSYSDSPLYNGEYKYFANGATIKRTKLTDSTFDNYWTAAKINEAAYAYYYLAIDGTAGMSAAQNANSASHGIVPCFCI